MLSRVARRTWRVALLLLIALIGVASRVEASDGMRGDHCIVAASDYIAEDFYFFCRLLDIYGTIDGDLIGVAAEVTLYESAVVTGDLWVGGGRLIVSGAVGDDIHFAGLTVELRAGARFTSQRLDLAAAALNVEVREGIELPGDLLVYGYQARVDGRVGGDVDFDGEALLISGAVGGRVDADVGDAGRDTSVPSLPFFDVHFAHPGLWISEGAYVGEAVSYRSTTRSIIPPGVVQGRIQFEQVGGQTDITQITQARDAAEILRQYLAESLRDFVTLMIVGVVALAVVPNLVRHPAQNIRRRTVPTVGWGLLTFMLSIPFVILVIVIGLIAALILYLIGLNDLTIMVGVALLVVSSGLIGGLSFLLLFMGQVVVSFVIGQLIYRYALRMPPSGSLRRLVTVLAIGAVFYAFGTNVPLPALGLIVELVTALAGVGAVVMYLRALLEASNLLSLRGLSRGGAAVVATTVALPPAELEEEAEPAAAPPGLEDLPEGFRGFPEDW